MSSICFFRGTESYFRLLDSINAYSKNWIMCGCFANTYDAEQKDLVILTETAPRQSRHRDRLDLDKVDTDTD